MVYVKEDRSEEVTDSYEDVRNGVEGVTVETDDGYFEYFIPIKEAPDYMDQDEVLSADSDMRIVEAPGEDNESVYDGFSSLSVPQKVVDEAERLTGVDWLE